MTALNTYAALAGASRDGWPIKYVKRPALPLQLRRNLFCVVGFPKVGKACPKGATELIPDFQPWDRVLSAHLAVERWSLFPLRLIVRYGFMEHGLAKLAKGPDAFAHILQAIGVPAPHFAAWATLLIEVFGGLAVILGAFVTLASLPMAAVLLVAMFTVHLPYGFSSIKLNAVTAAGAQFGPPGYEVNLLYLACLAALVLAGPGPLTIDGLIRKRRKVRSSQNKPIHPSFSEPRL
jgi:putative oxidoreductase